MAKNVRQKLCLILLLLCLPSLGGCVLLLGAAAGGAGTAYWFANKLSDEVSASYDASLAATRRAMASLKLEIEKEARTEEVTQFISTYTDGSKIWIDVRPMTQKTTKIEIRVGVKGDKAASGQIMDRIKSYL
jgi:hypothetical protein